RPLLRVHRGAVHGRDARADPRDGARRSRRGRDDAPRRRLQAAYVALRLPGTRSVGALRPLRAPYAFRGFVVEALHILAEAREETGLPLVTELMDPRDVAEV